MIKVENVDVWGFEHAIRGMRNPMNSWDKSDTVMSVELRHNEHHAKVYANIGKNDLDLMQRLYKAGPEHRKYLRQIMCSFDCTAPLYWWKEFDTYKVGTVSNSCSTMHKIHAKPFELEDFSHEHVIDRNIGIDHGYAVIPSYCFESIIRMLNTCRDRYLETKDKTYWWQLIQLLPSSYNQKRTITMNYENVATIIHQRSGHKLDEWNILVDKLKQLPYVKEIMCAD